MITEQQFEDTLAKLFGSGSSVRYPKRHDSRLVFLAAAALSLESQAVYDEPELNGALGMWLMEKQVEQTIDHVVLRRYLVNVDFLQRDPAGKSYRVNGSTLTAEFDSSVLTLDIDQIISQARAKREERKRQWQQGH